VKKFSAEPIHDPLWKGDCRDSLATGQGILYDTWKVMRYRGEMKNGWPEGYGAYYKDYITEGNWLKGKPLDVGYFLREVRFTGANTYNFINNGMRYLLNTKEGFTEEALVTFARYDAKYFTEHVSADTSYVPFPEKRKNRKAIPPPEYYASYAFFIGTNAQSGFITSSYYKRFLVRCKYSGDWHILYFTESYGKRTGYTGTWETGPFGKEGAVKYKTAGEALKVMCFCD
jgi:hypothetical protein